MFYFNFVQLPCMIYVVGILISFYLFHVGFYDSFIIKEGLRIIFKNDLVIIISAV